MSIQNVDFQELLPELKLWNNNVGIDIDSWISCIGIHQHLIGYGRIIWPDFIEHDDCVFLGRKVDQATYQEWLVRMNGNKTEVEAVMNHQHIVDIFSRSHKDLPTAAVVAYLAQLMSETWNAKLIRDFPGKTFTVKVYEDTAELFESHITLFQNR